MTSGCGKAGNYQPVQSCGSKRVQRGRPMLPPSCEPTTAASGIHTVTWAKPSFGIWCWSLTRAATRWQLETTSRPHPTTRGRLGRRDGVLGLAHRGSSGYAASTHEPERLSVTVADAPAVCLTSPSKTGGSCAHGMTGPSAYRRLVEGFSKPGIFGTAAYR